MPSRGDCCASPFKRCGCPPGPKGREGAQGATGLPGPGLLSVVQLDYDLAPAIVPDWTTIISTTVTSTTGRIAVWASLGIDLFPINPDTGGQMQVRITVDGVQLVATEAATEDPVHDLTIPIGGGRNVTPGVPLLIELQWREKPLEPDVLLACEPLLEPDEEHASLFVADVPLPPPPP